MSQHYILKDRVPVSADLLEWARWFETADREISVDRLEGCLVSTVFLGLDQGHMFETMVFGGDLDGECVRYATIDEAEAGHREMLNRVKNPVASEAL